MSRTNRMIFMSPAEARFVRIMGGKVLTFDNIKSTKTGFPLTYVRSLGKWLKERGYEREVRVGSKFTDFGSFAQQRGIEIDGRNFHRDIVKEQERDDYFEDYGWILLHIQAADLWQSPDRVQRDVIKFITPRANNKMIQKNGVRRQKIFG